MLWLTAGFFFVSKLLEFVGPGFSAFSQNTGHQLTSASRERQLKQDYTVAKLAELLRVHVLTIRRWIVRGGLRAKQIPVSGGYRIPSAEVDRIRQPIRVEGGQR